MNLRWSCVPFEALTGARLYALLRLRTEVFVVEQNCVFQDMDGADAQAMHLMGETAPGGDLMAYARCFGPGVKYLEASIGRVVTAATARGGGVGHLLMREAVAAVHRHWGAQPIRIGAQAHLQGFYGRHGFVPAGEPYLEDGIPHIEMLRQPTQEETS